MPKKFLTVNDVARLVGVSPLTVRNWDQKGKLRAYRNPVNNYRMYKIEEVEALLKQIERSKDAFSPVKVEIASEE
jgi:DNA (cytosine-5)-methyltransferase 1